MRTEYMAKSWDYEAYSGSLDLMLLVHEGAWQLCELESPKEDFLLALGNTVEELGTSIAGGGLDLIRRRDVEIFEWISCVDSARNALVEIWYIPQTGTIPMQLIDGKRLWVSIDGLNTLVASGLGEPNQSLEILFTQLISYLRTVDKKLS